MNLAPKRLSSIMYNTSMYIQYVVTTLNTRIRKTNRNTHKLSDIWIFKKFNYDPDKNSLTYGTTRQHTFKISLKYMFK